MSIALPTLERDRGDYAIDDLPESDGKPMAETQKHIRQMVNSLDALIWHFREEPELYVMGNMFVYFVDALGTLRRVAPDIFAVRGVSKEDRRVYALEREDKAPDLVIEFTSKKTRKIDSTKKPKIYSWLGVKEYFIFDPLGDYLRPRLLGHKLVGDRYVVMEGEKSRLRSTVLGLDLVVEGENLRFYHSLSGEKLLTHEEAQTHLQREAATRQLAEVQTQLHAAARQAAEAEVQREANARRVAEAEAQREVAARQAAETEIVRLREELARARKREG